MSGNSEIVEVHDTSATSTPSWPLTATSTNIETSQSSSTLGPPAIARYIGTGGSNYALIVAGATSVGAKLTTQAAGSTTWPSGLYVETYASYEDVKAVALATDYLSAQNRWHLALVYDEPDPPNNSTHTFTIHTHVESGSTTQPYGSKALGEIYPGSTISLASDGTVPWLGYTRQDWVWEDIDNDNIPDEHSYQYAAVYKPQSGGAWVNREVSVKMRDEDKGDFVKVAFVDGRQTASYIDEYSDVRVFASYDATKSGCSAGTENSCWRRTSMLLDTSTPVLGRTAVATQSSTAETAAYVLAQNQAHSSYPSAAMSMTARIPHLTCSSFLTSGGGTTYGPPKIVGNGTTQYAVYKKETASGAGLMVRKWDASDLDGDAWQTEQTVVAPGTLAVADFDATYDGTNVQITWIDAFADSVKRRYWSGSGALSSTETVDTSVTDTGVVRIGAYGSIVSFAYSKSGDVYYREVASGSWSAAHAALNDASLSYRVLSTGLAVKPSSGGRRIVGVLSDGTMKTAVCDLSTCDASGDWSGLTSLGAPNVTGGAWKDHRVGVSFSPDGTRSGIVAGGTSTSLPGTAKLYLHENTGSGFAASPTEIDAAVANLSYTASGSWADLRYNANGNWKAVHYDATNDEVRLVRQWLPGTGTTSRDVVRYDAPFGVVSEIRFGVNTSGDGFGVVGVQENTNFTTRLFCEPIVQ